MSEIIPVSQAGNPITNVLNTGNGGRVQIPENPPFQAQPQVNPPNVLTGS